MKKIKLGTGFVVFVIFFGLAMIQSARDLDGTQILFWITMAVLFVLADNISSLIKESDNKDYE